MKKILVTAFSLFLQWNISQGQTGQALNFDGADDYVTVGSIITTDSYSKEAWVFLTNSSGSRNIISSLHNPFWISSNRLSAGNSDNYGLVSDPLDFPLNTWTHVAVTYDAASTTMTLYRNGVQVSQNTSAPAYVAANELIGSHNGGSVYEGSIDEVHIWDRALSPAEVLNNTTGCGIPTSAPGLLANFHFNQGVAGGNNSEETMLTDASGNSNNGTLINFSLSGPTSNWVSPGTTGSSTTFRDVHSSCGPFTWMDGVTYTESNNTASKTLLSSHGCDSIVVLDLTILQLIDQSASADQTTLCSNNSTTIHLGSSQTDVKYYLKNDLNNTAVDGPFSGTGAAMTFNTGRIPNSGTYHVMAKIGGNASEALEFSGNNYAKYVDLGNGINSVLEGTNTITVEAWVKRTEYGSLQTIASNYQNEMQFLLRIDSDRAAFWVGNGNFNVANGGTVLPVNTWMHISGSWDGATLKVYYNGVLDGASGCGGTFNASSNIVKIGGGLDNRTEYFPGLIGDVRIWNIARTEAEINTDQSVCASGDETGLLALYTMNDGPSNNTLTDITGHGYNGVLVNMDSDNDWTAGPPVSCAPACQLQLTPKLEFSVLQVASGTFKKSACGSYTWIDGNTYTESNNTAVYTLAGGAANGCDSVVRLDLTIYNATTGTDHQTVCISYTWIDGITYTESNNTTTKMLTSSAGCDSLVTLNLTIITIPDETLTATSSGECNTGNATVSTGSSNVGIAYYLREDAGNKTIDTLSGTGDALNFGLTNLKASTTYNVYAEISSRSYLNFEGSNQDVAVSKTDGIPSGNSNYTIEAMIKPDVYGTKGIVGWGSWGESNRTNAFRLGDGEYLINYWWDNDLAVHVPGLTDGAWHHVAATFDGTTRSMYVDGVLVGSDRPEGHDATIDNFRIGSTFYHEYFDGGIDEVRIWNVGKTQEEIAASMNISLSGSESGLVAYYTFDDGKGSSVLTDRTGNEHTGELSNMDVSSVWEKGGAVCSREMSTTASVAILNSTLGTDVLVACDAYTWIDGITYTESNNTATFTLTNAAGCDSVVTLNLTIGTIDKTTTTTGNTITANVTDATYKWIDCKNKNQQISGATNQSFTSSGNGSYAVLVTNGACSATSACVDLVITGTEENTLSGETRLFPNPTNDNLTIDLGRNSGFVKYTISSVEGIIVFEGNTTESKVNLTMKEQKSGLYFIKIGSENSQATYKIIKQ